MDRNVALLFDGTWNNRQDETNVLRMRESIDSTGEEDPLQLTRYVGGVGANARRGPFDRLAGGLFGHGLSDSIKEGYAWLCRRFRHGDRIFVFGFSRGGYSARSCVGLIRKCGLVRDAGAASIEAAYALYRDKSVAPDDPRARAFRQARARETRVRFIGVWDTVGSLGIPLARIPFSADYYRWHDTRLSGIVDYAYHAIAVDEQRPDYRAALWTERVPPEAKEVEQRWFIGAHANVGGGYRKKPPDALAKLPLRWIQDKAEAAGLRLRGKAEVLPADALAPVNDSYAEFAYGLYRLLRRREPRAFGEGVNETVDPSVWLRWNSIAAYRPSSLGSHPDRPLLLRPESA